MKLIHFSLKKLFFLTLFFLLLLQVFVPFQTVFGQVNSSGIAVYVAIEETTAAEGTLISFSDSGYHISKVAYDPQVFGVVTATPAATLEEQIQDTLPVVSNGKARVRVTAKNGAIEAGDLLTASDTAGVAQKASQDGYVIGTAFESFTGDGEGLILANLNFGFSTQTVGLRTNLLETLNLALKTPFLSPAATFRYILAGLVVLISLGTGLWFFGRVANRGVEALGRNPLASKQILAGISFNLVLSLATLGIGLAIAYLILIL